MQALEGPSACYKTLVKGSHNCIQYVHIYRDAVRHRSLMSNVTAAAQIERSSRVKAADNSRAALLHLSVEACCRINSIGQHQCRLRPHALSSVDTTHPSSDAASQTGQQAAATAAAMASVNTVFVNMLRSCPGKLTLHYRGLSY